MQQIIVPALAAGLPQLKIHEYFDVKKQLLYNADFVLTAFEPDTGVLAGILGASVYQGVVPFIHICFLFIVEVFQRSVVIQILFNNLLREMGTTVDNFPSVVALKTPNPRSYRALRAVASFGGAVLYPRLELPQVPEMTALAIEISRQLDPNIVIDSETGILRDAAAGVPEDFYDEFPQTSDDKVNAYFREKMTPRDRLLCVLSVTSREVASHILRGFGITDTRARMSTPVEGKQ
jgi:hypothetical protein